MHERNPYPTSIVMEVGWIFMGSIIICRHPPNGSNISHKTFNILLWYGIRARFKKDCLGLEFIQPNQCNIHKCDSLQMQTYYILKWLCKLTLDRFSTGFILSNLIEFNWIRNAVLPIRIAYYICIFFPFAKHSYYLHMKRLLHFLWMQTHFHFENKNYWKRYVFNHQIPSICLVRNVSFLKLNKKQMVVQATFDIVRIVWHTFSLLLLLLLGFDGQLTANKFFL